MNNPGATPPAPEELERAEDSARSNSGVDDAAEAESYLIGNQRQTAQINEFNRQEFWKKLVNRIRLIAVGLFATILVGLIVVAVSIVLWLIVIVVVHYTIPRIGWLTPAELTTLGKIYSNFTQFVAPAALISNAWLVAYFSIRRWRKKP